MSTPVGTPDSHTQEEAEQIIEAIRSGCVDAFVVEDYDGQAVYTLQNADLPYSALVQKMQQGAAMLNSTGEILYCNPSLAALLGMSAETIVGRAFTDFIQSDDRDASQTIRTDAQRGSSEGEIHVRRADGSVIPTRVSFTALSRDGSVTGLLVTDLTAEKSYAELASRLQSVQDQERRGIARELHDSVGQLLAAITMNLTRFRKEASNLTPALAALVDDSSVMVEQVSKEIRTISHLLHPPLLDMAGLSAAIRWYVDGFSERSNIKVDLHIPADCGRLSSEVEIALFRVVQECLTNVYRHSGTNACTVTMAREAQHLRIEIRDNGRGIRPADNSQQRSTGLGLRGMQERLRRLGGTLEITSTEQGTTVTATLPA
jgi:PAS domain S-box-containing protein